MGWFNKDRALLHEIEKVLEQAKAGNWSHRLNTPSPLTKVLNDLLDTAEESQMPQRESVLIPATPNLLPNWVRSIKNRTINVPDCIRVVAFDDSESQLKLIEDVLSSATGIELVGSYSTSINALELCRRDQPHIALVDIKMPEVDGLEVTRLLKNEWGRNIHVVIVSTHNDPWYIIESMTLEISAYITKEDMIENLPERLRLVMLGDFSLDSHAASSFKAFIKYRSKLTEVEFKVFSALIERRDWAQKEIAYELGMSFDAFRKAIQRVSEKLNTSGGAKEIIEFYHKSH